jgi:hypothetical protein
MLAQRDEVRCEEKLGKVRKVGKTRRMGKMGKKLPCTPAPLLTPAVGRGSWIYLTEVVLERGVATKQLGKPQLIPSASNQVEQHGW